MTAVPLAACCVVLDDALEPPRLRARLEEGLAGHPARLVADVSRCGHLGADALALLLEAHRTARRQGGELVLRGVGPRLERLLALTGVTGVFRVEPA